jgi:molecular chaperone GrpE
LGEKEKDLEAPEQEMDIEEVEELDEKDKKIQELEQKIAELEDKYIRVFSEFENYKKRLEKEKSQAIEFAIEQFAKDLLPVVDALEMAIKSANDTDNIEKLKEGVELTLRNFFSTLNKHGVEKIDTDSGFDPNMHEAVMRTPSDEVESGEIVQVLQPGYKLKERVLRATLVSVAE